MVVGLNNGHGFISYHLWVYLHYKCNLEVIKLSRDLESDLDNLKKCDVIIHLAERNRGIEEELYRNNTESCTTLIKHLTQLDIQPLVIYTSSIHEESNTLQGKWRRDNKESFKKWSKNNNFISLKLPNIFGPFCKPNYNSFVATLCNAIVNDEQVNVNDTVVPLLYVDNLCKQIYEVILNKRSNIEVDSHVPLKELHQILSEYKTDYIDRGIIPNVSSDINLNIFNTLISYIPSTLKNRKVKQYSDDRGTLSELVLARGKGQVFYSTTNSGYTRGNHFHTKRIERFCVLQGTAQINLRKVGSDEIISYIIKGDDYQVLDIPVYYTHNLVNIGDTPLVCCFWMNDLLTEQQVNDTYFENV